MRTYRTESSKAHWPPRPLLDLLTAQGWEDHVWHNDAASRWLKPGTVLGLWIDDKVPDQRECGGACLRYAVTVTVSDEAKLHEESYDIANFERTADLIAFLQRDVAVLGATFKSVIGRWLTQEQRLAVDAANDTRTDSSCATHNYCDSNMAMFEAFVAVFGREPVLNSDADLGLFNEAWGWAIDANFADPVARPIMSPSVPPPVEQLETPKEHTDYIVRDLEERIARLAGFIATIDADAKWHAAKQLAQCGTDEEAQSVLEQIALDCDEDPATVETPMES